jgi:hypothetical protein
LGGRRLTSVGDATAVLDRALIILATVLMCGLAGWMLLGLRHVSHDDLYFESLAYSPDVSWWDAARQIAVGTRRFSHLLNVPVALLGLWLADQPTIGDLAILGQLAVLVGGTGLLLRRLVGGVAACGWAMLIAGGFALHWYFMPPLAFPLLGLDSPTFLTLSLICLVHYADGASRPWLWLSSVLSTFGIVWPESSFILFPLIIGAAIWLLRPQMRERIWLALAFLPLWAVAAMASLLFRILLPSGTDEARLTISLDFEAWGTAAGMLLGKGILPIAMFIGVDTFAAHIPGMPKPPSEIDFGILADVLGDNTVGFSLVLVALTGVFLLVLRRLAPRFLELWLLFAAGLTLTLVPACVVAMSSEYQRILNLGYLQGAVVTAEIQVGFLTAVFAAAALLALRWPRLSLQAALALALAGLCLLTLSYNLINRDLMAANLQKWKAFDVLADALPDGTALSAPTLWQRAGVSAIPSSVPTTRVTNYWTERALLRHGKRIAVDGPDAAPTQGAVHANYGVRPEGLPILLVRDATGAYLLAAAPIDVDSRLTGGARWRCEHYCRLDLPTPPDAAAEAQLLTPLKPSHTPNLVAWLILARSGAFGWEPDDDE